MKENEKRNTLERRAKILDILNKEGQVRVQDISRIYNISEVSVRNDFAQLEQKKLLIRTRGGAIKPQPVNYDIDIDQKIKKNFKAKQRIGKRAAELINDGDTIILDSGSTTLEIAKNLSKFKELNVITNSLYIIDQLLNADNINIIVPGGNLRGKSRSMVGSLAEQNLQNFYCDKAFLGVDGIDANYGISTPTIEEALLGRVMINIAREVIIVTDSSKFEKRSFAFISPINDINTVITDSDIPANEKTTLEKANIKCLIT